MKEITDYAQLPEGHVGGRSGWGVLGDADNVGLLHLQEPDKVLAAARLIRRGKVFPLDAGPTAFAPAPARIRDLPRHTLRHRSGEMGFDDVTDNFYPQVSSHWDGGRPACHSAYPHSDLGCVRNMYPRLTGFSGETRRVAATSLPATSLGRN